MKSPPEPRASRAPGRVVAVIIHHRGQELLAECLESLLASVKIELEIVLVLNHCLEDLPDVARNSAQVHHLELHASVGFGHANNLGVAWAKANLAPADFYYFVNNDTRSCPETLAQLVTSLTADPEAAIAGPQTLILTAPDHINSLGLNVTEDAWGWDEGIGIALADYGELPPLREVLAVTGSALLIDSACFAQVGGWSEIYDYYFEDIDLAIKVWKQGRRVVVDPQAIIFHRISATMTVGAEKKFFFFWRNRLLLALLHWPWRLLWPTLRRAYIDEIRRRPPAENELQRRAFAGAMKKLPRALWARLKWRGRQDWTRFLKKVGSVPVITLPSAVTLGTDVPSEPAPPQSEPTPSEFVEVAGLPALDEAEFLDAPTRARLAAFSSGSGPRVLICGRAPLPFENQRMNFAPGFRTWHLTLPLVAAGNTVLLVCPRIPGCYFGDELPMELAERDGALIFWLDQVELERPGILETIIALFRPEVAVGVTPWPAGRLVKAQPDVPIFVDLFGDPLSEGHAKETLEPEKDILGAYYDMTAELLSRGDMFSAVSERHRSALLGQLSLIGRLRGRLSPADLVCTIPCAQEVRERSAGEVPPAQGRFLVLWQGGFNTWCDVDTLIEGLEIAMAAIPELVFKATGSSIRGHDEMTFRKLEEKIATSAFSARFELLGEVPKKEVEDLLNHADLMIVTERRLYERELGSSGRILEWLAAGKAFICTAQSDLARQLEGACGIPTYEPEDALSLGQQLIKTWQGRDSLPALGAQLRDYCRRYFQPASVAAPLIRWIENPTRTSRLESPNWWVKRTEFEHQRIELEQVSGAHQWLAEQHELLIDERIRTSTELAASTLKYHEVRSELGKIHQSRFWRLWMTFLRIRRFLSLRRRNAAPTQG